MLGTQDTLHAESSKYHQTLCKFLRWVPYLPADGVCWGWAIALKIEKQRKMCVKSHWASNKCSGLHTWMWNSTSRYQALEHSHGFWRKIFPIQNTVKLCDFGWAGIVDYKGMKTTFCGTLDYVSPEMKDKGCYTSKVDLWSIGVLTFELLTGIAPFRD